MPEIGFLLSWILVTREQSLLYKNVLPHTYRSIKGGQSSGSKMGDWSTQFYRAIRADDAEMLQVGRKAILTQSTTDRLRIGRVIIKRARA